MCLDYAGLCGSCRPLSASEVRDACDPQPRQKSARARSGGDTLLLKFYLYKYLVWQLGSVKADMGLIRLRKANEAGEDVGVLFVNTDQIVAIIAGQNTTELQMTDGHTRWVKNTPEEVVSFAKTTT